MLSSVINSPQAIQVNITYKRTFVKIREWALNYSDLQEKMLQLQQSESEQNHHISRIYQILEVLLDPEPKERNVIGFKK